eukprot:4513142-Pyramimonas_sp.AAC.1
MFHFLNRTDAAQAAPLAPNRGALPPYARRAHLLPLDPGVRFGNTVHRLSAVDSRPQALL